VPDEKSLKELLDAMPAYARVSFVRTDPKCTVVVMSVGKTGWGFGELKIVTRADGQVFINAETSSKETVMEFLKTMVDGAIMDTDTDPEKHRAFNEATGVISCGCGCDFTRTIDLDESH